MQHHQEDQGRFVLFMVLSALLLGAYYMFYAKPVADEKARVLAAQQQQAVVEQVQQATPPKTREDVLAESNVAEQRITVDGAAIYGSFNTSGSRFDDISLRNYKETIKDGIKAEKGEEDVVVLTPKGAEQAAYIYDGWALAGTSEDISATQVWEQVSGQNLSPTTPVTLKYAGQGYDVTRTVTMDENYLITLDDVVQNTGNAPLQLVRRGASVQHGVPDDLLGFMLVHEGPIAVVGNEMHDMKYDKLVKTTRKNDLFDPVKGQGGWAALTDHYWLSAAIPPQDIPMTVDFTVNNVDGIDVFKASYQTDVMTVSPGATRASKGHMFVGAKTKTVLEDYETSIGVPELTRAIDWGFLGFLTKPMTAVLVFFGNLFGNFGLAIIAVTFLLKVVLFPLNNKSYASMAKMKKLQPRIEKLKTIYGDDRMKLQQEMMALYKKEGANPAAGCLPVIPQIFIFFALYKSLLISTEMRHAPFFGYIQDLSARDPLSILNGFGAFPWSESPLGLTFLAIGPMALLYGLSMLAVQTLSPMSGDKMQKIIFRTLPLVFMFILAPFAAGLLVYWIWNNVLTFIQQYYITRKFKVETPFDRFFAKFTGKAAKANDGAE